MKFMPWRVVVGVAHQFDGFFACGVSRERQVAGVGLDEGQLRGLAVDAAGAGEGEDFGLVLVRRFERLTEPVMLTSE
ncbi:MAG: hypothetical protein R3C45_21910 [Phycisphaerales bacterium]